MKIISDDAEVFYEVVGEGPAVVLVHAFPVDHNLWRPVAERLAARYRLVLMDLRGHGQSSSGEGPATMEKHAADLACVCDSAAVGKAVFGGVSIGGYVLFEFWRRSHERFSGLILADTRAQADTEQARTVRLQAAEAVERNGPDAFLQALVPKLLGKTTLANRPDLVEGLRAMMAKMTIAGIAAVQRGMAARPSSVSTLRTITVPTLLLFGDEDTLSPVSEGELMRRDIAGSRLQVLASAGHLAVFEQQDAAHQAIRDFLDHLPHG
jgi:pimeloyl-ACP methyl ester carboxylesterase